jgi:uncharacterized protein with GYD domain
MAKYIVLGNWTDQGMQNAKDTVRRYEQVRDDMRQMGVGFDAVYWTMGRHDIVAVLDAPDDATVTTALLRLGSAGNVSTETLRAFLADEMSDILKNLV